MGSFANFRIAVLLLLGNLVFACGRADNEKQTTTINVCKEEAENSEEEAEEESESPTPSTNPVISKTNNCIQVEDSPESDLADLIDHNLEEKEEQEISDIALLEEKFGNRTDQSLVYKIFSIQRSGEAKKKFVRTETSFSRIK